MPVFYWELDGKVQKLRRGGEGVVLLTECPRRSDHEETEKQRGQLDLNLFTEPWRLVPLLIPFQTHPQIAVPPLPSPVLTASELDGEMPSSLVTPIRPSLPTLDFDPLLCHL